MAFLLKTRTLQELNTICITMVLKKEKKIIAPPLVQLKACSCYCVCSVVDVLVTDCFSSELTDQELDGNELLSVFWHVALHSRVATNSILRMQHRSFKKNRLHLPINLLQLNETSITSDSSPPPPKCG